MAAPENRAPRQVKVPVGEVAMAAYRTVFGRLGLAFDLAWLPLLVLLAVELVPGALPYFWPAFRSAETPFAAAELTELVEAAVALLCLNTFALRWYQALLLRDRRSLPRHVFDGAWRRFLAYALLLYIPIAAAFAALRLWSFSAEEEDQLFIGVASAVLSAALLAVARFSFVFPAAASGAPMSLSAAWRHMRGNTWRLIAATFLVCAPVFIAVSVVLSGILGAANFTLDRLPSPPPFGLFLLGGVVETLLDFLFLALGAAVIAEFYRRIMADAGDEREPFR